MSSMLGFLNRDAGLLFLFINGNFEKYREKNSATPLDKIHPVIVLSRFVVLRTI